MGSDVTVVRDERSAYDDGTVASVRVLSVPTSDRYLDGLKYAFHYGEAGGDHPIIRFDNHHGPHELHIGPDTYEIDFPGWKRCTMPGGPHFRPRNAPNGRSVDTHKTHP